MNDIVLAFVTGITTGGLSCLAVQGGLLATSIARQIEQDIRPPAVSATARRRKGATRRIAVGSAAPSGPPRQVSLPIVLFLGAKLIAYTLLGFLLGAVGSLIELTPFLRALLQLAIGVFMIGNALRMFNVHPVFRYFNLEPPQAVTRYIRRTAKQSADLATPAFLGFLTVLIPCGVTQGMMALALGSLSPVKGATIMFAFTLGTTPVFFTLAYLATRLGAALEKRFALAAACVLLVLGVVSIDGGLKLAGVDISLPVRAGVAVPAPLPVADPAVPGPSSSQAVQTLTVYARADGYQPTLVRAKAGIPAKLALVTNKTRSCARAFVIPRLNIQRLLPETGTVWFDIPPQAAGTTINFTCSMGMYTGKIQFVN